MIGTDPVRETSTTQTPHEVCQDVTVQERLPERDGNVGGTVVGAVVGGLLGNRVGGGNGKKAATAAGAVAGGFIGNQIDKRHVGGRVVNRTERQCHTETATSESSRVTGYNVTYRNEDGTTGTMRMASKPGSRIAMGTNDVVKGYNVTYRYDGAEDRAHGQQTGQRSPAGGRWPAGHADRCCRRHCGRASNPEHPAAPDGPAHAGPLRVRTGIHPWGRDRP